MTTNVKLRLAGSTMRIAMFAALALTVFAITATTASASSTLPAWGVLHAGESLTSPNGRYMLAMQSNDGNLVEYQGGCCALPLWSTNTIGHPGARLEMQGVGNAVVYSPSNVALWWNSTSGQAGSHLVLQDDGNLVIYPPTGPAVWANYAGFRVVGTGSTLAVRTAPSLRAPAVGNLPDHTRIAIMCQTTGDAVVGSSIWDKIDYPVAGYVPDWYTTTPDVGQYTPGLSICTPPASPPPPSPPPPSPPRVGPGSPPPRPQGLACTSCSFFDGAVELRPNATIGGVYAKVRNYSPWVDSADGTGTSAWVGLQGGCSSTGCNANQLAQIGWRDHGSGKRDTLVQFLSPGDFSDCDGVHINKLSCGSSPIPAQTEPYTYYTILYNYEPGKFTFYVDGNKVASAPATFVPQAADVVGETHMVGDQVPGDASDPQVFADIHVWMNGAWQAFTPTQVSQSTPSYNGNNYGGYLQANSRPGSGTCLGIWDTAYGDASAAVSSICAGI